VSSADLAPAGSEAEPVLHFGHWSAVRRCAFAIYAIVLVVWSYHYGIPVQRELVILWTCGALACASIGRPPREIIQLVLDWLPIVAVLWPPFPLFVAIALVYTRRAEALEEAFRELVEPPR